MLIGIPSWWGGEHQWGQGGTVLRAHGEPGVVPIYKSQGAKPQAPQGRGKVQRRISSQ